MKKGSQSPDRKDGKRKQTGKRQSEVSNEPARLKKAEKAEDFLRFLSDKANKSLQHVRSGEQGRSLSHFGEGLKGLLDLMNCSQLALSKKAGVTAAQVSAWVNQSETSKREIGAGEVCKLAWAIADLMEVDQKQGVAKAHLDIIVNSLLLLAGYSSQTNYENVVWRSKVATNEPKKLRVGWFEWLPFLDELPSIGPNGFAQKLTEHVCKFFHTEGVEYEKVPLNLMSEWLRERRIDLTVPIMMRVPRRFSWLNFSDPIPNLRMEFDGVMLARRFNQILSPAGLEAQSKREQLGPHHLDFSRVESIVARGESTAAVIPIALGIPIVEKEVGVPTRITDAVEGHVGSAIGQDVDRVTGHASDLIYSEILKDKTPPQVLFTNKATCEEYSKRLSNELVTLRSRIKNWQQLERMSLRLAFGVHTEEPKLLTTINESLRELRQVRYFDLAELKKHGLDKYHRSYRAEEDKKKDSSINGQGGKDANTDISESPTS